MNPLILAPANKVLNEKYSNNIFLNDTNDKENNDAHSQESENINETIPTKKSFLVSKSNLNKGRSRSIQSHLYHLYDQGEELLEYQNNDLHLLPFSEQNQPLFDYQANLDSNPLKEGIPTIRNNTNIASFEDENPLKIPVEDDELIQEPDCIFKDCEMIKNDELEFFSKFESGNLECVWKHPKCDPSYKAHYYLQMHFDNKTTNHSQWFYFRVKGMKIGEQYRFTIVNCIKGGKSMFLQGMGICVYSEKENNSSLKGWVRTGNNIKYYKNNYIRPETVSKKFFSLEFTYSPQFDEDTVYFTQAVPYTYTYLQDYLSQLEVSLLNHKNIYFHRDLLCYTVASNRCEILTITEKNQDQNLDIQDKPCVFLSARVHPGEVQASHMMHGTISFLTSEASLAQYLRSKYVFKIVPMLNPDGCRIGNYRTNIHGIDLNRTWSDPDPELHPTIFHTKQLISQICKEKKIILYMDYHGHSRKKNIFIYGCSSKERDRMIKIRIYPHILSENSELSYKNCQFNLFKSKMGAARCAIYKDFDILWSFTIEASLCGPANRDVHYGTQDYNKMGEDIVKVLKLCEDDTETANAYNYLNDSIAEKKSVPIRKATIPRLEKRLGQFDPNFFATHSNNVEIHVKTPSPRTVSNDFIFDNKSSETGLTQHSIETKENLNHQIPTFPTEDSNIEASKNGTSWSVPFSTKKTKSKKKKVSIKLDKNKIVAEERSLIHSPEMLDSVSIPTSSQSIEKLKIEMKDKETMTIEALNSLDPIGNQRQITWQSLFASSIFLILLRFLVKIFIGI